MSFMTLNSATGASALTDMVRVAGGEFRMGSDHHYVEEKPARPVTVDGFWIDRHTVTNAEFAEFIAQTGYVTVAERPLRAEDYPDALPELLIPGSLVFHMTSGPVDTSDFSNWWSYVPLAQWRFPEGPGIDLAGREQHPVVHVAFEDAATYAAWAGKELPTEAEWEYAARGGLEGAEFVWGDDLTPEGVHLANTWQGPFPWRNFAADGFAGTSPVCSYPPNGFGLYDMAGNVWQWTADWFSATNPGGVASPCCAPHNPRGVAQDASYDPAQPRVRIPRKVLKGGSFLCAPSYCRRYRPAARHPQMIDSGTSHIGFRCVRRDA
jgi:sulfatase modifying factor 1